MLVAHVVVDRASARLVELELSGDELARLLAGQALSVPGAVGESDRVDEESTVDQDVGPHADEPADEPLGAPPAPSEDVDEVADETAPRERAPAGTDRKAQGAPAGYSSVRGEPPAGTDPIRFGTDVVPNEPVVAYIGGRWRDAIVVRRDVGSVLVSYTRPGPFGEVLQRVAVTGVRRPA